MKHILLAGLLFASGASFAQTESGMHFEHGLSWKEIRAKAKAEHKYIFMDAFTTWCGPCKMMAKNIFPQPEVGAFYNEKFINVKVQLDTTKTDNEEVKKWYQDAHDIMEQYEVRAFPTYLFFGPDGEIVHRQVGSSEAAKFIAKGKDALDPAKQYYTLKRKYEAGDKAPASLLALAKAAQDAYDKTFIPVITKEYLATQTDLTTEDNIKLLADATESTKDAGFKVFLNNAEKADKVLGRPGMSAGIVKNALNRELLYPALYPKGSKPTDEPNWEAGRAALKDYPQFADEMIYTTQARHYQRNENWPKFKDAIVGYVGKAGGKVSANELNSFAWAIFENCDDAACIAEALKWSKQSVGSPKNPMFLDTYANLLYKSGKKDEAIKAQEEAIAIVKGGKEDASEYEATLAKMKKGEKTW